MTRILNRYGVGVPKGDAFAGVGEILIDSQSGVAYTITAGGDVKPLGGGGSSDGSGAGMVISETEPADPETGLQWLEATTGRVWIWDEDKWLEFPAAVPEAEAGAGSWDELEGKPTEFPPEDHTHEIDDVNGLQDALDNAGGAPAVHVGDSPPDDPVEGQQWLNTDDGYLYLYYSNAGDPTWIAIGGSAGEGGSGGDGGVADPYWDNVILLINADGLPDGSLAIPDASGNCTVTNVNNVVVNTTDFVYGTGSADFNPSGSPALLCEPDTQAVALGLGDFTIEGWARTSATGSQQAIVDFRERSTQGDYPTIMWVGSKAQLSFYTQSTEKIQCPSSAIQNNTWFHFAAVRASGTTTLYVDGIAQGSFADSIDYKGSDIVVGSTGYTLGNSAIKGQVDDLRITKGVARYLSDFTPPDKHPTKTVILKETSVLSIDEPELKEGDNDVDLP